MDTTRNQAQEKACTGGMYTAGRGGTASLRPVSWLVRLGVVAATVGAWLAVGAAREWPESSRS